MMTPAFLVISPAYSNARVAESAAGLSQFLRLCSVLLFMWSGDLFRQSGYVRQDRLKPLIPLAAWFVLAPMVLGTWAVMAPGYLASAVVLAAAGALYAAILLERRMIGAGLTALVLVGMAITHLASAVTLSTTASAAQSSSDIFMVNAVLSILASVGIHLLVFEDMTYELRMTNRRLETAQQELQHAATTDPLTGCHNRRFFEQVMDRELQRHARFMLPLSLLFIDIDRFKAINDTLGHDAGDRVLQYVATFLKRHIREADYVFRWGGDEFLVLITCTGEEAKKKAAALKVSFDAAPEAIDLPPGIGLSVGSIEVPAGTNDLLPLIGDADTLMYHDKGKRPTARATPAGFPRPRTTRARNRKTRPIDST
jgi:diguanylate cyclase (GGDEF)-like protein